MKASASKRHRASIQPAALSIYLPERLEARLVLSASFDITGVTALRNDAAFSNITGAGVGIAVLDTGVDAANPDLTPQVEAFYNAVENPVDTTSLSPANAVDHDGHGTHVSGIAASSNPAIGVANGAKLVDIKVIADSGESQLGGDPVLRGLEWVANNYLTYNIKVVNMSLGQSGVNDNAPTTADQQDAEAVEIKSLQNLGITIVSAAGNSYAQYISPGESFPAIVSTIAAGNTWADAGQASDFGVPFGGSGDQYYAIDNSATPDTLASTSQRSSYSNMLLAPGEDIYSDWNGTLDSSNGSDLLHNTISGTSMASPFIAGTVALMQQAAKYFGGHYLASPSQILQILLSTADTVIDSNNPSNARYDSNTGATSNLPETGLTCKRVDVLKAIQAVQSLVTGGSITVGPHPGPDQDNTTTTATPVNNIDGTTLYTFDGSIGTDGLVQVGANDVDLYQLNVVSTGQMTFTLSLPSGGTAFAAQLQLFDGGGAVIAHATGTAGSYPTLTSSGPLAVGTYYLGISSAGNAAYTINGTGAAGGSSQGDYQVQVSLNNPDPNGTIQGAFAVDLTEPTESLTDPNTALVYTDVLEQGELGSDPPPAGSTTRITVSSDVDMFKVTAPDNGTLSLDAVSDAFSANQTLVEVFDASQNVIGSAASTNAFTGDNPLSVSVTAGQTYYVAVTVPANAGFNPTNPYLGRAANATPSNQNYALHLRFDNGDVNGTALDATSVNIGAAVTGNVGTDNGVTIGASGSKDVDWYSFTASNDGLFDITAQSAATGFTPVVTLWAYTQGNTNIVKVADTSSSSLFASSASAFAPQTITPPGTAGSAHVIYQVSAGQTYFVAITGQGNSNFNWYALASGTGGQTGGYTLSTQLKSLSALSTLTDNSVQGGSPQTVALGQTVQGNIGADGALVIGPTDVDIYKFVATANQTIDVRTYTGQEGDADTVLRVFDSSGDQIAANDNINSSTTASEVKIAVQSGQTYYIGVDGAGVNSMSYNALTGAGAGAGSTGNYGLSVTAAAPGFSVATPAAVAAYTGSSVVFTVTLDQPLGAAATVDYATSDGTAIAGADYTAMAGTLTFPAGVTVQTVTVPVLPDSAAGPGNRAFTFALSNAAGAQISGATATGTIEDVPVQVLTFKSGKPLRYTDSLRNIVTLSLSGAGTGTAIFVNNAADPSEIKLDGTAASSNFIIKGPHAPIGGIVVNGSLASISGTAVTLDGGISVSGSLGKLTLGNVDGGAGGGTISIGGGAQTLVKLGQVSDESLSSTGAIKSIAAANWLNSGGIGEAISSSSIGSISTLGDFAPSINASAIGPVKIGGALTGGIWTIAGGGSNLRVNGAAEAGWSATFGGALNLVHFASEAGSLAAASIARLTVTHNLASAAVTLTGAGTSLGGLTVGGAVSSCEIRTAGSIGNISVRSIASTDIFAGVNSPDGVLPSAASDFTATDQIVSFTITGSGRALFSSSNIAAASIGKVAIAGVNSSNNGTLFGIACRSLVVLTNRGVLKWTDREPVSRLTPLGDFVVKVLT